jgi:hypothetical protein
MKTVEREIQKLTSGPSPVFESIVSEYPWLDPKSNKGFIDLVATQRQHPATAQHTLFQTNAQTSERERARVSTWREGVPNGFFEHTSGGKDF